MATIIRKDSPRKRPSGRATQPVSFSFSDMRGQANDYLGTVRAEAAKIVQQAHQQAEQIRRQAEVAGRKAAEAAVERISMRKLASGWRRCCQRWNTLLREINDLKGTLLVEWESSALKVATAIAERIIRREVSQDPQISLDTDSRHAAAGRRDAPRSSCTSTRPTTRTWERKLQRLAASRWRSSRRARLSPMRRIAAGGCRVETKFGEIDQQIESQLRRIEEELI